ncbi:MAG TPA: TetR/AcrR family transcriptional regulator [Verrucomicrobiae bacterium]
MGKSVNHSDSATRQHLLDVALRCFARQGYAATSVREIVDAARVSKPVLYYYFADKADLFHAVVDSAHDERYRLMLAAARRGKTVRQRLEEMVADVFEYSLRNRELLRLTFATAFAMSAAVPGQSKCREKGRRNFELVRSVIEQGQAAGELTRQFSSLELALGIYGQVNSYVMFRLLVPDCPLNRDSAKEIVRLFLHGAAARPAVNGHALGTGSQTRRARTVRNRSRN